MIPTEDCAALSPETREFWNSITNKEKSSILRSTRDNPKPKPTFPTNPLFNLKANES